MLPFAVVAFAVLMALLRVVLASQLPLFGDEAFYWECSRRLAWGYADHPFVTAGLVRLGTDWLGDSPLGVRLPFLLLSCTTAPLVFALARPRLGARGAWLATAASQCLPLAAVAGSLAVPDVPLLALALAAIVALDRTLRLGGRCPAWLFGACTALGLATHLRFLLVLLGALVVLCATARGRRSLGTAPMRGALLLSALGFVPWLLVNVQLDFAPLLYQLVGRHASSGGAPALWEHVGLQCLVVGPLLYLALLAAAVGLVQRTRRGDQDAGLLLPFSLLPLLFWLIASPFADARHDAAHWTLSAYLPLCVGLPPVLDGLARRGRLGRLAALAVPVSSLLLLALVLAHPGGGRFGMPSVSEAFSGWRELAAASRLALADLPDDTLLVADTYQVTAQLAFALPGHPSFTLDHESGERDGRALQYVLWQRDGAALAARQGAPVLLVVEITATDYGERSAWRQDVLARFDAVRELGKVEVPLEPSSRMRRFLLFAARVPQAPPR